MVKQSIKQAIERKDVCFINVPNASRSGSLGYPTNLFEILFWYAILVHRYSRLTEKFPVAITVGASIVPGQCNRFVEFRG